MEEAASISLVGLTAWQALIERFNLKKGQKIFIQAGSGGVGTFAIQLAKHVGATVATTTSSANFDLVKKLGADILIDYKKDDFETVLQDYDLVLHSQECGDACEVTSRSQAWGNTDLDLRPSGSGIRKRSRRAVVRKGHRPPSELRSQEKGNPT
jgi:D-arabinose 1-dehydrogenase-like Zn-dependent alcohol dehydrogenase